MKTRFFSLAITVVILVANTVMAQEPTTERVSTMIDIRNDLIVPEKGESQMAQSVNVLWRYKGFGGFLETDYKSKSHTLTIKPSLLFRLGSWHLLGGLSTNSQGADFAQTGAWFIDSFGNFKVLADLRNFWSISGRGNSYTDNLLRIMYPITSKFSIGADLAYDHWWNETNHNWYFVGPRISYQLTKGVSIYTRVSREWDALGDKTQTVDRIRLALAFAF